MLIRTYSSLPDVMILYGPAGGGKSSAVHRQHRNGVWVPSEDVLERAALPVGDCPDVVLVDNCEGYSKEMPFDRLYTPLYSLYIRRLMQQARAFGGLGEVPLHEEIVEVAQARNLRGTKSYLVGYTHPRTWFVEEEDRAEFKAWCDRARCTLWKCSALGDWVQMDWDGVPVDNGPTFAEAMAARKPVTGEH